MKNSKQKAIRIISIFENLLKEHNIIIPDELREDLEEEACIYGNTYYALEDKIVEILNEKEEISKTVSSESGTGSASDKTNEQKQNFTEQRKIFNANANEVAGKLFSSPSYLFGFLDLMSRFYRYSANNLMALYHQLPTATKLKNFDDWKNQGCTIKKGQKAIKILKFDKETETKGKKSNKFVFESLFDVSQTDCKEKPKEHPTPKQVFCGILDKVPVKTRIVEDTENITDDIFYDNELKTIFIAKNLPVSVQINGLCREVMLFEISMRDKNYNRDKYIHNCSCAAYSVCKRYGVDASYFDIEAVCTAYQDYDNKKVKKTIDNIRNSIIDMNLKIDKYLEVTLRKEIGRE